MASTRRLAAIMFTDMVGSTAAAQANEPEALRLRDEQEELLRPLIASHEGRSVKSMGDGGLAEFDSALRAVQCAIDIQRLLHERNARGDRSPIRLRIGIHLGDVESRGSDIFGDSVNVASKIEPLADPGGICISESVYEQVRTKIPNDLQRVETGPLKGVRFPLEVFRVRLPWLTPPGGDASAEVPRIAVLPFANISPDPNDAYFAEGLTEELISALSLFPELLVIARTSVAPYKATTKGIALIGAELGVGSILEGSVRKAGDQLRITIQLIDVATQGHRWAKSYDRQLNDVFALQSEIADQVAQALRVRVGRGPDGEGRGSTTVRTESYLAYVQGQALLYEQNEAGLRAAKHLFLKAIAFDARNAAAHARLSVVTRELGWNRFERGRPRSEWDQASRASAARAIELDPTLADAHYSLGLILWDDYDWVGAEREFRIALGASPSHADALGCLGTLYLDEGRPVEGLRELEKAERADPRSVTALFLQVEPLCWSGRLDEAKAKIDRMLELDPLSIAAHWGRFVYWFSRSDLAAARQEGEWLLAHQQRDRWHVESILAVMQGELDKAREWNRRADGSESGPDGPNDIGWHHAVVGDLDECFRWLNIAVQRFGIVPRIWRLDPHLAAMRRDPRFQELLKSVKLA